MDLLATTMREIVTLQLGNLSNYVATHFWNAQESYFTYSEQDESVVDHDIHWRAGIGSDGSETFLPRAVVYDLKGGFGTLRKINALYEDGSNPASNAVWSGPSAVHKQQPLVPSAYQQSLDAGGVGEAPTLTKASVRYWSDFSRSYFHPKSLVQLYDFELNSSIMPFERFHMGTELFHSLDKEHDIVDRDWRPFVEECDQMQGMQVLTTIDDAWGGFASAYIEALRDEYPKSCIWVWGLQNPLLKAPRDKRQLRLVNTAHGLTQMREQASMIVPLSVPEQDFPANVALDPASPWHTSALLGAAMESASLPSRLKQVSMVAPASLEDMVQSLNSAGNQTLARLQASFGSTSIKANEGGPSADLSRLGHLRTPLRNRDANVFGRISTFRGNAPEEENGEDTPGRNARNIIGSTISQRYNTDLLYPLLDSQPSIFTEAQEAKGLDVETLVLTDDTVGEQMKALKAQVTWSLGVEEREALSNDLSELADAYHDEWSSGSDDGDDDI